MRTHPESLLGQCMTTLLVNLLIGALVGLYAQTQPEMLVRDIQQGAGTSNPLFFVQSTQGVYFVADDGITGTELWFSDGSFANTYLVKDINPEPIPTTIFLGATIGNILIFRGDENVHGSELWISDGTQAGTTLLKDIDPTRSSYPLWFINVGGTVFFKAGDPQFGTELWKTDGTLSGTVMVKDINPGPAPSSPRLLTDVNGTLFFYAKDGVSGDEPWKSDGTAAGTVLVKDIRPGPLGSVKSGGPIAYNGEFFFSADDNISGLELWKSDGTPTGTVLVKDIRPGALPSVPGPFAVANGTLFFLANDGVRGIELWKTDGTSAGTVLVADINPGPTGGLGATVSMAGLGNLLIFGADDGLSGQELWKTDGSAAGTSLIKDINPGGANSQPSELNALNGLVYFGAGDGQTGFELWQTDGTTAGTTQTADINPAAGSGNVQKLQAINSVLYYDADDGATGLELHALQSPLTATITPVNPPIIIPGTGGQFQFDIEIRNRSGVGVNFAYWTYAKRATGGITDALKGPFNGFLNAGAALSQSFTQVIPVVDAGNFTYHLDVAASFPPGNILAGDSFPFTITVSPGGIAASANATETWVFHDEAAGMEPARVENTQPERLQLIGNYPNPFNPETTISYRLPAAGHVRIQIFDIAGRAVRELVNANQGPGAQSALWDGKDYAGRQAASGVYLYQIQSSDFKKTGKMLLVK